MEWQILAKRFLEHEVTFTFRCKTLNGCCKRIERCLAFRCFVCWIRKTKEKTNASRSTVLAFEEGPEGYKIELIERLMKELEENTIEQIRTLLNYLEQTDLLKNKDILRCLDVIAREYGGKVVDEN